MAKTKAIIFGRFRALGDFWRSMAKGLFDAYRPEQHYMRGPGPRCREKQNFSDPGLMR